ncbi:MAG: DUF1573 domain-containing protein [Planctomycetota bacterium]
MVAFFAAVFGLACNSVSAGTPIPLSLQDCSLDPGTTEKRFELPQLVVGRTYNAELTFQNKTGTSLDFDQVTSSCGCTAAVYAGGKIVEPLKEFTLNLSFSVKENRPFQSTIRLHFRDKGRHAISLTFVAKVAQPVAVDKPVLLVKATERSQAFSLVLSPNVTGAQITKVLHANGPWVTGFAVSGKECKGESSPAVMCDLKISPENDGYDSFAYVNVEYMDQYGKHSYDVPVQCRQLVDLAARPRQLVLRQRGDTVQVRFVVVGDFRSKAEVDVEVRIDTDADAQQLPVFAGSLVPVADRVVVVDVQLERTEIPHLQGELIATVGDDCLAIPYSFLNGHQK